MKKTFLALMAIAFCVTLSGQQVINSEQLEPFTNVSFTGNVSVELIKGDHHGISINLYDADVKNLKWSVSGGNLSVSLRHAQTKKGLAEIKVYHTGELRNVSINKGELTINEPFETLMAKFTVGGGGKLVGKIDATDLQLEVTGNSVALLEGETIYLTLRSTERSKVDVRKLEAVSVEAETTMGSEASVNASERLIANAKTGSAIFFKGNPSVIRDNSSKLSNSIGSSVTSID